MHGNTAPLQLRSSTTGAKIIAGIDGSSRTQEDTRSREQNKGLTKLTLSACVDASGT
jgi:hypothetical protein